MIGLMMFAFYPVRSRILETRVREEAAIAKYMGPEELNGGAHLEGFLPGTVARALHPPWFRDGAV